MNGIKIRLLEGRPVLSAELTSRFSQNAQNSHERKFRCPQGSRRVMTKIRSATTYSPFMNFMFVGRLPNMLDRQVATKTNYISQCNHLRKSNMEFSGDGHNF